MVLKKFLKFYFLLVAFFFAMSSSYYLYGGNISTGIFPQLYYIKHMLIVFLSIFGLIITFMNFFSRTENLKVRINLLISLLILTISYLSYVKVDYGISLIQFLIFIFSVVFLSYLYDIQKFLDEKVIFYYFLIVLFIPFIDLVLNNGQFLLNSYYGRERLLMGFFHPKEAGIMFLSLFIMVLLNYRFNRITIKLLFNCLSVIFLYFVQSRNSLLFLINFLIFNFLIKKLGFTLTLMIILLIYLILPITLFYFYFEEIDILLSYRLSVWISNLDIGLFGKFFEESLSEKNESIIYKLHIDNFYLEFLTEAGIIPFLFLTLGLIHIAINIKNVFINGYSIFGFYLSFLIFCFFDSGMFSTGNFFHIFVWSILIFSLRNKEKLNEHSLR